MAKKTEIVQASRVEPLALVDDSLYDTQLCRHIQWLAERFAASDIAPGNFRGKPENCFLVIHQARRLQVDPLMMMSKTYVVHGKMGMEAQLAIALVNARGPFKDGIQWTFKGEGMGRSCTAWAHRRESGNKCEATVSMKMAQAEGWMSDRGSKWHTLPDLMLQYRSAMFLARLHCPEVLLGMLSSEELRDMEAAEPPPPLVTGRQEFGKAKPDVKQLRAEDADPVVIDGVVTPRASAPAPTETAVETSEAPVEPPAATPEPEKGFVPSVGQYVRNGPRGQVVRVTNLNPPRFMKADGTEHERSLWPPNMMPWNTDSKDAFTDGSGVVHPASFSSVVYGDSSPDPDAAQGPDPDLPIPLTGGDVQDPELPLPSGDPGTESLPVAEPTIDPGPFDDGPPPVDDTGDDALNQF